MTEVTSHRQSFRAAVRIIESQRKLLAEASADPALLEGMSAIIRYLYKLPDQHIDRLFGIKESTKSKETRERAIKIASAFTLEQVESSIESEASTRSELEAIAIGRFHVPKGSMRSLGNLDRLRDKLKTFVQNERTHATITELARSTR